MNTDKIVILVRQIAKSSYWQTIYSQAKETKLQIFDNNINLTHIQILFLNYLQFYNSIYLDITMGDINEIVLENEIYEDAYMYYKIKVGSKDIKNVTMQKSQQDNINQSSTKSDWIFNRPSRK